MNKKLFAICSLLIAILLIISGCDSNPIEKAKTDKPAQLAANTNNEDYKIGKNVFQDEAMLTWQEELADKKGVFVKHFDQYTGVLIGLGVKNTGGYSVKITEVKKIENKWVIKYEEKQPPKGTFVTQAFTNVYEVVYLPKDDLAIEVYQIQGGKETKATNIS